MWIARRRGKRGISYRLRWLNPRSGQWQSEACGRDLAYARLRREEIRQELRNGFSGKLPLVTLEDLIGRLGQMMAGKRTQTIDATQRSLKLLNKTCKVGCIAAIDRGIVMEFRANRLASGASAATVNKDLRQIRSALSYAVDAGLLRANPILRWRQMTIKEPEKMVRVVEEAEFTQLLASCLNPVFKALLIVAYRQGLRRSESLHLRWHSINLKQQVLHIVNIVEADELTKSRKNRSLPMHPFVHQALSDLWAKAPKKIDGGQVCSRYPHVFTWPDGRLLKPDWVCREFAKLVVKSGIRACTLHDLRRSFSTLAQRAGVDKYTVKDLGGWSEVSVVERHYTGEVQEVYRRAMQRIAGTA